MEALNNNVQLNANHIFPSTYSSPSNISTPKKMTNALRKSSSAVGK